MIARSVFKLSINTDIYRTGKYPCFFALVSACSLYVKFYSLQ